MSPGAVWRGVRGRAAATAALLAVAGAGLSWLFLGIDRFAGIDDANIFLTYARNLAGGEGFVFHPGGERVEGFTSLGWLLVATLAEWVPGPATALLFAASVILTAGFAYLAMKTAVLLVGSAGHGPREARWVVAALGVGLLFQPALLAWSTVTLMDGVLWTLALLLTASALVEEGVAERGPRALPPGLAVALALLLLARPESMMVAPGIVAAAWAVDAAPGRLRRLGVRLAFLAGGLGLLVGWRLVVFGYPFPNTYYAKVSPDLGYRLGQGLEYVGRFLLTRPVTLLLAGVAAGVLLRTPWGKLLRGREGPEAAERGLVLASAVPFLVLASAVVGGGDHFGSYRFLQPAVPFFLVAAAVAVVLRVGRDGLARVVGELRRLRGVGAAVGLALLLATWADLRWEGRLRHEFELAAEMRDVAASLAAAVPLDPLPTVGMATVGGFSYRWRGPTLDLLGLNWTTMAHAGGSRRGIRNHAAFDPDVFWSRPPELMLPDRPDGARTCPDPQSAFLGGLVAGEAFRTRYRPVLLTSPTGGELGVYVRRDVLPRLPDARPLPWSACG